MNVGLPRPMLRWPRRLALVCLLALPAFLSTTTLTGCLTDDAGDSTTDTTKPIDIFPKPKPIIPRIIPLSKDFRSSFAYARFDSAGGKVPGSDTLLLHVSHRPNDTWTYAFDNPAEGYLLRYVETLNRDSAGVWIVGSFKDGRDSLDSIPTLWVPQYPDTGRVWGIGRGRKMTLDDSSVTLYTDPIQPLDGYSYPQGFQKHTALRFRETAGDTVTIYHFKSGLGCLAFERSAGGKLLAAGTLVRFELP